MAGHRLFKTALTRIGVLSLVLALAFVFGPGTSAEVNGGLAPVYNAILISWDGVQRDHLRELLEAGQLPNLQALIHEGTIVEIDVTHKTDTKAGHAQMLTGYGPEVTGVYSNAVYRSIPKGYTIFERLENALGEENIATVMITGKAGNLGSKGPERAGPGRPGGANRWKPGWNGPVATARLRDRLEKSGITQSEIKERLKKVFGDDKVGRTIVGFIMKAPARLRETLLVARKRGIYELRAKDRAGDYSERRTENGAKEKQTRNQATQAAGPGFVSAEGLEDILRRTQAEPFYNAKPAIDLFEGDISRTAAEVGNLALASLDRYGSGRFFAFFHFSDPDHAGHRYGENSIEYSKAIITADEWLGRIVAKLKELGIYERTRIYVTSDHGMDEGKTSHAMAPHVFLATNDPGIKRRGDQRDIVPTILSQMGIDLSKITPALPGRLLTQPERAW